MKRGWAWRPSPWEIMLAILTLAAGVWSAQLSPYYLNLDQIADSTRQFIFPGLLALGLMVVVVLGEIDISLASTLAVGSVLFSKFSEYHVQVWVALPIVMVVCGLLGALNGLLVASTPPAVARGHAWHNGRLPWPCVHHRHRKRVHRL